MLRVQVAEIPEEGLQVDVDDNSWFPGREFRRRGDLHASVFLSPHSGRVLVNGSISLTIVLNCDRCLEEFDLFKKIEFRLTLELEKEDLVQVSADHECDRNEMDVIYLAEPVVDVGDILYQQVVLALPQKAVCNSDCKGLCSKCGVDLNREECQCHMDTDGSPFSVLAKLLDEEK